MPPLPAGSIKDLISCTSRFIVAVLLAILPFLSRAEEPINKLNLCSKTRQNVVIQVDSSVVKAVATGDVERVRAALASGTSPNSTNSDGFSLLHTALTENQDAVLDLLLKSGVDVNQPFMGASTLTLARASTRFGPAQRSDEMRLEQLTKAGAVLTDFDEAFNALLQLNLKSNAIGFIDAMMRGDMSRLELFVRATYDINAPFKDGASPLHAAAAFGTPEVIRYLVRCGASVNAKTSRGRSVMWFSKTRPDAAAVLRELGATEKD